MSLRRPAGGKKPGEEAEGSGRAAEPGVGDSAQKRSARGREKAAEQASRSERLGGETGCREGVGGPRGQGPGRLSLPLPASLLCSKCAEALGGYSPMGRSYRGGKQAIGVSVREVSEEGEQTGFSAQQRKVTFWPLLTQVPLVRKPSADVRKQLLGLRVRHWAQNGKLSGTPALKELPATKGARPTAGTRCGKASAG